MSRPLRTPGSPAAQKGGCRCPRDENGEGMGFSMTQEEGYPYFMIRRDCPMHGVDTQEARAAPRAPATADSMLMAALALDAPIDHKILAGMAYEKLAELNGCMRQLHELGCEVVIQDNGSGGQQVRVQSPWGMSIMEKKGPPYPILAIHMRRIEKL